MSPRSSTAPIIHRSRSNVDSTRLENSRRARCLTQIVYFVRMCCAVGQDLVRAAVAIWAKGAACETISVGSIPTVASAPGVNVVA